MIIQISVLCDFVMCHVPKKNHINIIYHMHCRYIKNNIFFEKHECVTIDKICVTNQVFLIFQTCSHEVLLTQYRSVTRVKKKCYTMKSL